MLVLKSIGKVLGEIISGTLFMCLALAAFFVAMIVFGLALSGIDWLIGAIFGGGWTAFKAWFGGAAIYLLCGLAVLCVIALFIIEVRGEYLKMKAAKEGKE